jgi:hypothetical protein
MIPSCFSSNVEKCQKYIILCSESLRNKRKFLKNIWEKINLKIPNKFEKRNIILKNEK